MELNQTIQQQLAHRSIRAFKDQALSQEEVDLLVQVAQATATSNFLQGYAIINITDPALKEALAKISGQAYVAKNGHLFVFIVDQYRNTQLASAHGASASIQGSTDRLIGSLTDAVIAAQNMVVAAESLGLGTVYLGSLHNDAAQVIDLLGLPEYTFPAVGLAVGYPDQDPQTKPRLPKAIVHMENGYQALENPLEDIKAYDETIANYYKDRSSNSRVDTFTNKLPARWINCQPNAMNSKTSSKNKAS